MGLDQGGGARYRGTGTGSRYSTCTRIRGIEILLEQKLDAR